MEMHQLRYVVAVARTGNISRAAEQCHVSQPSLSQQLQKLEDELGERLFHRMRRETRLTAQGETFLPRARRILEEVDAAKREAAEAQCLLRGTLSLGVLPTIAPYLLPRALVGFAAKFPAVSVTVHEDTTARLVKLVAGCELDMALASRPIHDPRLEIQDLFTEELLLAVPPHHPLARQRTVRPADLEQQRLIVMKEGHCLGDQVLGFCERRQVEPQISFRSAQLETVQALVRSGVGVSLVPAMAARDQGEESLVYRSFLEPRPERKIVALWLRQPRQHRAVEAFLRVLLDNAPAPRGSPHPAPKRRPKTRTSGSRQDHLRL